MYKHVKCLQVTLLNIISLEPQKLTKFLIVIEEDDNHNQVQALHGPFSLKTNSLPTELKLRFHPLSSATMSRVVLSQLYVPNTHYNPQCYNKHSPTPLSLFLPPPPYFCTLHEVTGSLSYVKAPTPSSLTFLAIHSLGG